MVSTVINSGFRRSGIYPFNPEALDYGVPTNPASSKQTDSQHVCPTVTQEDEIVSPTFTPEQEVRFT